MTDDAAVLLTWAIGCLSITAVCVTAFPIMYAFSPWYKSPIGRALMTQAIAFMLAIDMTLVAQFWQPDDIIILFWINAIILSFVAIATGWLTVTMVKANYMKHQRSKDARMSLSSAPDYDPKHAAEKSPLLSDSFYDKLKPAAALFFPALITFWLAVATIWHWDNREEVAGTLAAVNTLLGVLLVVASMIYKKSDAKFDGTINVTEHENGLKTASLELKNFENPADVVSQDQALFKVNKLTP